MKEVITEKDPNSWAGGTWRTLLVKDDVVGLKTSHLVQGPNRYSGKTYARFQIDSNVFYSWRHGRLRVYSKKGKQIRDITPVEVQSWMARTMTTRSRDVRLVDQGFKMARGETTLEAIEGGYPLLGDLRPAPGIMAHLAQPDIQSFTREFFGKSNYRKDLVRRVAGLSQNLGKDSATTVLLAAKGFNNLVPIDWIIAWMTTEESPQKLVGGRVPWWTDSSPRKSRAMFKTAEQKQLRRLLKDDHPMLTGLTDTIRDFQRLHDANPAYSLSDLQFSTFRGLHDVISRDASRIQYPREDISYTGKAKKLAGNYGDIQIVAPEDSHELMDWGQYMSNCISGYGSRAAKGQTLLYAVMKDGEMVANMELTPKTGNLRQLLGKYNATVPDEVADAIKDAIHVVWPNAETGGGWQ